MKKWQTNKSLRSLGAAGALLLLLLNTACSDVGSPQPSPTPETSLPSPSIASLTAVPSSDPSLPTQAVSAPLLSGKPDSSFGKGGKVTTDFGSELEEATDVLAQPDGQIVMLGEIWPEETRSPAFALVRYDKNGKLDPTFADGGKSIPSITESNTAHPHALALQPDGKIIAVGSAFDPEARHNVFVLLRYNADGTFDQDFGEAGKVLTPIDLEEYSQSNDEARALDLAPDGKIVVAGITGRYPSHFAVARYNSDGSLDETFGDAGRVVTKIAEDSEANTVAVQPDGKVLVGGYAMLHSGKEYDDYALVRYNEDGSLDETFADAGIALTDFSERQDWIYSIALQPDGKIVAAGPVEIDAHVCGGYVCSDFGFGFARYNPDGSLDTKFGSKGKIAHRLLGSDGNYDLILLPDGKLLSAGHIDGGAFGLALLNPDGSLVKSFGTKGWATTSFGKNTERANAIALQPDGKVVAVGTAGVDPDNVLNGDFALARYR
jgi:uncharacterized delta-60 repeat protein